MIPRIVKKPLKLLHRELNRCLHRLECRLGNGGDTPLPYTPVFIIGPPRSGSTLLYQVMVNAFDLGYLSNLHAFFYGSPGLIEKILGHPSRWRKCHAYESRHGRTAGCLAPSECGEFWYRFFRRKPQFVPRSAVDDDTIPRIRAAVRLLENAYGRGALFKNMNCALRLQPIREALPEAVFIVTHRELRTNTESLLHVRFAAHGDYNNWWSMEPPGINRLQKLPPYAQVVEQVRCIHAVIERERATAGGDRFFDIDYEALCADPAIQIARLAEFLQKYGIKRRSNQLPDKFELAVGGGLPKNVSNNLDDYIANF